MANKQSGLYLHDHITSAYNNPLLDRCLSHAMTMAVSEGRYLAYLYHAS